MSWMALPGMGRQMIRQLKALKPKQLTPAWQAVTVSKIVDEADGIKSFYLTPADGDDPLPAFKAGQFVTVRRWPAKEGAWVRCWSISNFDRMHYRTTIKRKPGGIASNVMHDEIKPGDRLEIMPPAGGFQLHRPADDSPVVLISAGVGITPMVSMLHAHAASSQPAPLHFIHTFANSDSQAFLQEVEAVIGRFGQFKSHYIDTAHNPRLNLLSLGKLLAGLSQWQIDSESFKHSLCGRFYLCGPESFIEDVSRMLISMGADKRHIFKETFTAKSVNLPSLQYSPAEVRFAPADKRITWTPEDNQSLLQLAESNGLQPVSGCRTGQCGLCASKLQSGQVDYINEPDCAVEPGKILLCCAIPKGPVSIELGQ